jgi:hypothetical protein
MRNSVNRKHDHFLQWAAAALSLIGIALVDISITAWAASLVGLWPLAASVASYFMIAAGVLFTIWQVRAISDRPAR